ncbi:MAG: hypothetical protein K0B05_01025 [Bacteroidales bacterium]|nr:hypothetical protein [Bacteroidales bacterium]
MFCHAGQDYLPVEDGVSDISPVKNIIKNISDGFILGYDVYYSFDINKLLVKEKVKLTFLFNLVEDTLDGRIPQVK